MVRSARASYSVGDPRRVLRLAMIENQSLVLDLVDWVARKPRTYEDVMAAWRTSCPRLPIWEDAVDHGFVCQERGPAGQTLIVVTENGYAFLASHGRACPPAVMPAGT